MLPRRCLTAHTVTLALNCTLTVVLTLVSMCAQAAARTVIDDAGYSVRLTQPARRIISLAPHATELLFAAGAGERLVGVSDYSNYPPAAKKIPSVGGAAALDIERIAALKPDLIVVWHNGNSASQIARLRSLNIALFESEPRDYAMIATSLERLAALAGTEPIGDAAARDFRTRLQTLTSIYRQRTPITVFYQIWGAPLMTLNGGHIVSAAIRLCSGVNVFEKLPQLAPVISTEAVLQADPQVIISGGSDAAALSQWRRFTTLRAVRQHGLVNLDADSLTRPSPRILDGTEQLCRALDAVRHPSS